MGEAERLEHRTIEPDHRPARRGEREADLAVEFFYRFSGGAQVGIGRGRIEAPYHPPAESRCPLCRELMAAHVIRRGTATVPTRLHCPRAPGA